MNTILLLSEEPISLARLEAPLRALAGAEVYYTSPSRLAVQRGSDFAAIFVDDDILNDYDEGELQERGIDPLRIHTAAVEFRHILLLRDVLEAVQPHLGPTWLDDDAGLVTPLADALRRLQSLDDASQI